MLILKTFIPGYYLFHSRLKRKAEILSWVYVYPLFICLAIFINSELAFKNYITLFLLALLSWISIYETGYIENDVKTIRKEKRPTLRISASEIQTLYENYPLVQIFKYIIGIAGLIITYYAFLDTLSAKAFYLFLLALLISKVSFFAHNNIRSRWNILTYFLLSATKYLSIPLLFINHLENPCFFFAFILLVFPVPRTMEHAAKIKYNISFLMDAVGDLDRFRIKYYFLLSVAALVLFYVFDLKESLNLIFQSLWFLIFRSAVFFLVLFRGYDRPKFSSHKW